MLLRGVPDIIKFLGRAVMSATTDEFLTPYIHLAQDGELTRALGLVFVAELDGPLLRNQLTVANVAIMPYVQKVLAWYAYQHYLPFAIGNDGDNGLQEVGTDSTSPVRIGVLDKRIRETEKNAIDSLESLLQYVESKPAADLPNLPWFRYGPAIPHPVSVIGHGHEPVPSAHRWKLPAVFEHPAVHPPGGTGLHFAPYRPGPVRHAESQTSGYKPLRR